MEKITHKELDGERSNRKEQELEEAATGWLKAIATAGAWCAARSIPIRFRPEDVAVLRAQADVLDGAIAGAGDDSVPEGVLLYLQCLRETARFVAVHGTVGAAAMEARELVEKAHEKLRQREASATTKRAAASKRGAKGAGEKATK